MIGASAHPSTTRLLEDNHMEYLQPGEKRAFSWDAAAKGIRFVTDAMDGSSIPGHIAWFPDNVGNTNFTVAQNNVTEIDIPSGRGCVVHRDDAPDSPTAGHQFGFCATT
jgi:hypothetical protein